MSMPTLIKPGKVLIIVEKITRSCLSLLNDFKTLPTRNALITVIVLFDFLKYGCRKMMEPTTIMKSKTFHPSLK